MAFNNFCSKFKDYLKNGPSNFMKIGFRDSNIDDDSEYQEYLENINILFLYIIIIALIIFGYIAVGKIIKGDTERDKNIRIGMYVLLLLTGGRVGIIFIFLWIFNININI
jgi:hypothetical protein